MPSAATLSGTTLKTGALEGLPEQPAEAIWLHHRITALEPERELEYNGLVLAVTKRYSGTFIFGGLYLEPPDGRLHADITSPH